MIIKDGGFTKNHLEDYLDGNESFEIRLEREKTTSRGRFIRIGREIKLDREGNSSESGLNFTMC